MADLDFAQLAQAAHDHGIDISAVQKLAAERGISLESAAAALGINVPKLIENAQKTIDKAKKVAEDVGLGSAGGAAIGTMIFPGVGTVIGGVVGTVAGAIYGAWSEFGGDITDFFSDVGDYFKGKTPVCLDFFRQPGSCDNIDLRMDNVVRAQRALRAHPELISLTPEVLATGHALGDAMAEDWRKYQMELRYAWNLLLLERVRAQKLDDNAKWCDHFLHANPRAFLGETPLLGVMIHGAADIERLFKVTPLFAQQTISAAAKLKKGEPPPRRAPPLTQIRRGLGSVTALSPALARAIGAASAPPPVAPPANPLAAFAQLWTVARLPEFVAYYLGGGTAGHVPPPGAG